MVRVWVKVTNKVSKYFSRQAELPVMYPRRDQQDIVCITLLEHGCKVIKLTLVTEMLRNVFSAYYLVACDIFTALHGMQTRFGDENSVCLSVRSSVSQRLDL